MQVYDLQGHEYATGNHIHLLKNDRLQEIRVKATEQNGGLDWIFSDKSDTALIALEGFSEEEVETTFNFLQRVRGNVEVDWEYVIKGNKRYY